MKWFRKFLHIFEKKEYIVTITYNSEICSGIHQNMLQGLLSPYISNDQQMSMFLKLHLIADALVIGNSSYSVDMIWYKHIMNEIFSKTFNDWIKENIHKKFTMRRDIDKNNMLIFSFTNKIDATLFKLSWR